MITCCPQRSKHRCVYVCVCVPGGGAGGTAGAPRRYWWDWWGAQSVSGGAEGAAQGQRPGETQHVSVFLKRSQISLYIDDEDPAETCEMMNNKNMEEFRNVEDRLIFWASEMVSNLYLRPSTHPVFVCVCVIDFSKTLMFSGNSHSSEQENRRGWAGEGERRGRAETAGKPPADPVASANNSIGNHHWHSSYTNIYHGNHPEKKDQKMSG